MMFGAEFGVIAFLSEHDHNLISEGGPSLDLQVRQVELVLGVSIKTPLSFVNSLGRGGGGTPI